MKNNYDDKEVFDKYVILRENPLSYNEVVEMPELKRNLPKLKNKSILDIGCGMGHLIEHMMEYTPKKITGVDLSTRMIDYCLTKESFNDAEFKHGDFMDIEFNQKFDVIVSSLVFHYIEDFNSLSQKLGDIMNKDGTLLFSMEHPIVTAGKAPETTPRNIKLKMDHYFDESERTRYWRGLDNTIDKYHHTVSTIFNNLIQNGFVVEKVTELGQTKEVFELYSEEKIEKLSHYPPFIMIRARKKGVDMINEVKSFYYVHETSFHHGDQYSIHRTFISSNGLIKTEFARDSSMLDVNEKLPTNIILNIK